MTMSRLPAVGVAVDFGWRMDQIKSFPIFHTPVSPSFAPLFVRRIWLETLERMIRDAGQDATEGNPQPSFYLPVQEAFRFRWTVKAGVRTISVDVKQPLNQSPRPNLTIAANPALGIDADVSASAPDSTDWVSIGRLSISPTADGAVWVHLANELPGICAPCWFDKVLVT